MPCHPTALPQCHIPVSFTPRPKWKVLSKGLLALRWNGGHAPYMGARERRAERSPRYFYASAMEEEKKECLLPKSTINTNMKYIHFQNKIQLTNYVSDYSLKFNWTNRTARLSLCHSWNTSHPNKALVRNFSFYQLFHGETKKTYATHLIGMTS